MITAHRHESSFVIILLRVAALIASLIVRAPLGCFECALTWFSNVMLPLKASGWCAKRGPRIGIRVLKLVVIFDYGEARSAAFSESG